MSADDAPELPLEYGPIDQPVQQAAVDFRVEVVRSRRRKKSVAAALVGDTLRVTVPSWMSNAEEVTAVESMTARFRRSMATERIDLPQRAAALARRYRLPRPQRIEWRDNMRSRWGSCQPLTGEIHMSSRLAPFPDWVIDYVIVHELAHLVEANHSPAFWVLVERFPRTERALGYLIAKGGDADID